MYIAPDVICITRKFMPMRTIKMAGDSSTELLFLDTFKHQSAEVKYTDSMCVVLLLGVGVA